MRCLQMFGWSEKHVTLLATVALKCHSTGFVSIGLRFIRDQFNKEQKDRPDEKRGGSGKIKLRTDQG